MRFNSLNIGLLITSIFILTVFFLSGCGEKQEEMNQKAEKDNKKVFQEIKIGIVADIHKCSREDFDSIPKEVLDGFISELNLIDLDFNVNLGDVVNYRVGECSKNALEDFNLIFDTFNNAKAPFYSVLSDHDVSNRESLNLYLDKCGLTKTYYALVSKDYQIIFLDTTLGGAKKESTPLTKEEKDAWDQGKISIEQVNWLKNVLENSNQKRVIIFSGHPLFTFEKNNLKTGKVKKYGIKNTEEIIKILKDSNKEIVAVTGDVHQWLEKKEDNIQFYVIDTFKYSNWSWSILEWDDEGCEFKKRKLEKDSIILP